jgi:hypothetical protein
MTQRQVDAAMAWELRGINGRMAHGREEFDNMNEQGRYNS